ncbi:acyl-CoA/acyl-ACP dehydrogenase [Roseomonas hellenica]|uniref:Acyl-CoA/acyl-ACP dehydrogenase n=1 Tax=Plastoroseomonas hellenica TaxID=2687306 RepID=A0ABS5F2L4_9PROT|nr:acyl-CoA dehydrogenase family protein [Plastoroseomonas hellenica]MBR0666816.1 acyl-CoA/acyl-ACP dehydrogenase [Plastoroseomonas hellenica]
MSEDLSAILQEQVARALTDATDVATLRALETGAFPQAAWDALEPLGLALALVPEEAGGAGLSLEDAAGLFLLLGQHAAPLPLAEGMGAALLLAAAGLPVPEGVLTFAAAGEAVPWGRHAAHVVLVDGGRVSLHPAGIATPGENIGREPRDALAPGPALEEGALPARFGAEARGLTALIRSAQMAGALQAALALAVDYANTRVQFGRPIGRFQAIQQQLALFAAEAAAASVAARSAARAADRRGLADAGFEIGCAKITAGEAAGTCAAIAHQVFAAIGVTEEHALHHLTRRLWSWREEGGTERFWAQRIGAAAQARGGAALWPDITARDEEFLI